MCNDEKHASTWVHSQGIFLFPKQSPRKNIVRLIAYLLLTTLGNSFGSNRNWSWQIAITLSKSVQQIIYQQSLNDINTMVYFSK